MGGREKRVTNSRPTGAKLVRPPSQKQNANTRVGDMAQEIEHMHEVLSSIPR
jgi:hypothetical protein